MKYGTHDPTLVRHIRVTSATWVVAIWPLGITLTCYYLASDQAERQCPWASCSKMTYVNNIMITINDIPVTRSRTRKFWGVIVDLQVSD